MNNGMFQQVSEMNEAYGNPKGNPHKIDAMKLLRQCQNIGSEFTELMNAFGYRVDLTMEKDPDVQSNIDPVEDIRDALCDIMVFALGAYHFMGFDADRDMKEVVDAVLTRFCKTNAHLDDTLAHYASKGVLVYSEGEFPRVCIKSAADQWLSPSGEVTCYALPNAKLEYPKGKFLKALGYRTPTFYKPLAELKIETETDLMERMAAARRQRQAHEAVIRQQINDRVKSFRAQLEQEAFGFEPFDDNKNQTTVPGGPHENALRTAFEKPVSN
jgi:predicted HAD superfamily Cof-like phosphohydrolase